MAKLPDDKKSIFNQLRQTIVDNIPNGFDEIISGKMLANQVPLRKQ